MIPIPNAHRPVIEGRTETGELSGEGRLFLIFALLESIAVDLATMKRRGLWRDDPEEAAAKPDLLTDLERQALRDWRGGLVDSLTEEARAISGGRVAAGRSLVRRWIRQFVDKGESFVRAVRKLQTVEEREAVRVKREAYAREYQKEYWQRVKSARALGVPVRSIGRPRRQAVEMEGRCA